MALIGCAAPTSVPLSSSVVPVSGVASGAFQVHEYALVEQSKDNPTHIEFQQRVPGVVAARRTGWPFSGSEETIEVPNQALAAFGYHLEANTTPPFSGYSLYRNSALIQRNIAKFWPISIQKPMNGSGQGDFLLSFETMDGEKLVASLSGIRPWPGQDQSLGNTPPVYFGNRIAFAESVGSEVSVYAGSDLLYTGPSATRGVHSLQTWGDSHWALELTGDVIVDGQDLNKTMGYDGAYGLQIIAGQPFYFFNRGGQVYLNYAGHELAYKYDQVVHDNLGSLAVFNPGGTGHIAWFYGLRDGVWYYVEVGVFE